MNEKNIIQIIKKLELEQMYYKPLKYLKKLIKNTKDIYENRKILKSISLDSTSIEYIVDLISNDLNENIKFKRVECLKILKRMIKNRLTTEPFSRALMKSFFKIYQSYIFSHNEEIQWAVSTFIKDQRLDDEDIQWLIDNYEESDHIVNRLLRYIEPNKLISEWAKSVYNEDKLSNRLSEVIAILIDNDIPKYVRVNTDQIMWAIYYSKCSKSIKKALILRYLNYEDYSSSLEISRRLGTGAISLKLLNYYKSQIKLS